MPEKRCAEVHEKNVMKLRDADQTLPSSTASHNTERQVESCNASAAVCNNVDGEESEKGEERVGGGSSEFSRGAFR